MMTLTRGFPAVVLLCLTFIRPAIAQLPSAPEKKTSVDFNLKGTLELVIKEQREGVALIEDVRDLIRDTSIQARLRERYAKVAGFTLDFEAGVIVEYKGFHDPVVIVPIKGLRSVLYLVQVRGGSGDWHDLVFELERGDSSIGTVYIGDFEQLVTTRDERKTRSMKVSVDQKGQVKDAQLLNPGTKGFTCFFNTAKQYFDVGKAGALGVSLVACLFVAPTAVAAFAPCGASVAQMVGYLYAARSCF